MPTTKTRLENLAITLKLIEEEQRDHPGYCADIATAIVRSELAMLARESEGR
jgi:hypothetical protein